MVHIDILWHLPVVLPIQSPKNKLQCGLHCDSSKDHSYSPVWKCYVGLWCVLQCISHPLNIACRSIQTIGIEQSQNWSILCISRQSRHIHWMWVWTYVQLHHPLHHFPLHSVLHHLCRLCMSIHNKVLWHWLYTPVGSSSITEVCMSRPDIDESCCLAIIIFFIFIAIVMVVHYNMPTQYIIGQSNANHTNTELCMAWEWWYLHALWYI